MPLVNVKLAEGVFTEKQKHDMAAAPTLMGALGRSKAAYEAIDGTPTTREDLAAQAPVRHQRPGGPQA